MLKLFELWNRHPDLNRHDALRLCIEDHARTFAATLRGDVPRYVTNVGVATRDSPPYDGIDEYWLDDETVESLPGTVDARERRSFVGSRQLMLTEPVVHVDCARRAALGAVAHPGAARASRPPEHRAHP